MPVDPNVLVGHTGSDDAGVYRISDELAMVLTVDFFPPIVDDAYDFGRVAATNSLSDVYAMGGRPVVALNIAGFPENKLPPEVLRDIIRGGADVAREAGVSIVGGHTVNDPEVKYGLSVVGLIDPRRVVRNAGARAGDKLVLSKPIGTGVLSTRMKANALDAAGTKRLIDVMTTLNREASELMLDHGVHACTDITGFGLMGHGNEMAEGSNVTIKIDVTNLPFIEGAYEAAEMGYLTGGAGKTKTFLGDNVRIASTIEEPTRALLFDAQTSGGLLMAVPATEAEALLAKLKKNHPQAAIIGECVARGDASIIVE